MRKTHLWLSDLSRRPKTKKQQEEHVGRVLAAEYEKVSGAPLEGNTESPNDPPDRLFTWRGVSVGAEMFELEQFYKSRAFFDTLAGQAYDAFRARVTDDRLMGIVVTVHLHKGMTVSEKLTIADEIKEGLRRAGLQLTEISEELADLVMNSIPPRSVSRLSNRLIHVDATRYPALAKIAQVVSCSSTRPGYPGSEENLPHIVPFGGPTAFDAAEIARMVQRIATKIGDKIQDRERWLPVDHRILVAHDFPRTQMYQSFPEWWEDWVRSAAQQVDVLSAFDELWLVTAWKFRDEPGGGQVGEPNGAIRILGSDPTSKMHI